jgi:hypothetical protein
MFDTQLKGLSAMRFKYQKFVTSDEQAPLLNPCSLLPKTP